MTRPATVDPETRTVRAILSTGAPVRRYGRFPDGSGYGAYEEQLRLEPASLRRIANAPVLKDHEATSDAVIGKIERARLQGNAVEAVLRFGGSPHAAEMFADVADGLRPNLSIGYGIISATRNGERGGVPVFAIVPEIYEASLVAIGADHGAFIRSNPSNLNRMDLSMSLDTHPEPAVEPATSAADTADVLVAAERARIDGILLTAERLGVPVTQARAFITAGTGLDAARRSLVDLAAHQARATNTVSVLGGEDHVDPSAIRERMADYLAHRLSGGRLALPERAREFAGASMLDLARGLMQARGSRGWLSTSAAAGELFRTGGMHTTSDFALLAGTSANRALLDRFQQLPPALSPIYRRGTAPDFRTINRLRLGEGSGLSQVNEHGEVTRGTVRERGESYVIKTYSKIWALTRKLVVNDDLSAFQDFVNEIGMKAATLLGDTLYAVLNDNAVLSDGVALFHSTHGNLAASASTLDVTNLSLARVAMRAQTGIDGGLIAVTPRYLVVGPARETLAEQVLATITPDTTANVNPFSGRLELVVEPRLGASLAWFLAADPAVMPALEYAELDGSRPMGGGGPSIETRVGFDVEGIELKCTYDVGAGAVAYQPLFKNAGA